MILETSENLVYLIAMPEQRRQIDVGGRRREYVLHTPASGAGPRPLVVALHGGGGTARFAKYATGWSEKADREGFLVAYPEGTRPDSTRGASFLRNPQFWNVGTGFGFVEREGVDDVAFMESLLDELLAQAPIDPARVYVTGFSNGASLALRLGVELSERIAAIAPVAGQLWRWDRGPARPMPMLYITGAADPLNPLDGGEVRSPWGRVHTRPLIADMIRQWARWVGCATTPTLQTSDAGVRRMRFGPAEQGAEVDFYVVEDMGHVWPGGREVLAERLVGPMSDRLNATDLIWEFFTRHALSTP
jgi:polyhydroxybutyrate depolymerase